MTKTVAMFGSARPTEESTIYQQSKRRCKAFLLSAGLSLLAVALA